MYTTIQIDIIIHICIGVYVYLYTHTLHTHSEMNMSCWLEVSLWSVLLKCIVEVYFLCIVIGCLVFCITITQSLYFFFLVSFILSKAQIFSRFFPVGIFFFPLQKACMSVSRQTFRIIPKLCSIAFFLLYIYCSFLSQNSLLHSLCTKPRKLLFLYIRKV